MIRFNASTARGFRYFPYCYLLANVASSFAAEPEMSVIVDAWQRRQALVHSFDIRWQETSKVVEPVSPPGNSVAEPTSKEATRIAEYSAKQRLVMESNKLRHEIDSPTRGSPRRRIRERTHVFDGVNLRGLTKPEKSSTTQFVQGNIWPPSRGDGDLRNDTDLNPIFRHFQPFADGGIKLTDYQVQSSGVALNGQSYVVLLRSVEKKGYRTTYTVWLDPRFDYSISRYMQDIDGKVISQLDVQYERSEAGIPVPTSWERRENNLEGQLERSVSATTVSHSLNKDIDDGEFNLTFPKHAMVLDSSEEGAEPKTFLVRDNDEKRFVTELEHARAKTLQDIISTETGHAGETPSHGGSLFLYGGIAAIFAVGVLVFIRYVQSRSSLKKG